MDGADLTPPAMMNSMSAPSSRPTLGFPLGTALLLIVIFCLSGVFSCCYHWEKLRSLRRRDRDRDRGQQPALPDDDHHQEPIPYPPSKLASKPQNMKQEKDQSLPVIMPGDQIPKFMAWPCPCQQQLANIEKTTLKVVVTSSIIEHPTPRQDVN